MPYKLCLFFLICSRGAQLEAFACEKVLALIKYTHMNPKHGCLLITDSFSLYD